MGCFSSSNRDDSLIQSKEKTKEKKKTTNSDEDDSQDNDRNSDSEEEKKDKEVLKLDKKKGKDDKKSDKKDDKTHGKKDDKKSNKKNDKKDDKKNDKKGSKKDDKKKGKKDDKEDDKEDEKEDNKKNDKKNDKKKDSKPKKMDMKKSSVNGVTLMKGIENFLPEDINEDQVYQLIEESLKESIEEEKKGKKREPGTITKKQAKVIASIIYDRIKKGKTEDINVKKYPELKGLDIKIGITKLTKDVVKDYIYDEEKVDEKKINSEYKELTKNNEDVNALTIQILS
jgi:hypothetical protein